MSDISNTADIIDVRDIIERIEELDSELDSEGSLADEEDQERADLYELLNELRGSGGDHQWKGDWYPVTLIRDSYFTEYARELAEDLAPSYGEEVTWPYTCIDWERAARELQIDYSTVEYGGVTYWYR